MPSCYSSHRLQSLRKSSWRPCRGPRVLVNLHKCFKQCPPGKCIASTRRVLYCTCYSRECFGISRRTVSCPLTTVALLNDAQQRLATGTDFGTPNKQSSYTRSSIPHLCCVHRTYMAASPGLFSGPEGWTDFVTQNT